MSHTDYLDLVYLIIFFLSGVALAVVLIILPLLIAPTAKGKKTQSVYECGMDLLSPAWIRFGITYYLYALIFLAFDVDILYLFPVAIAYNNNFYGREVIELVLFVVILSLAIVYAWVKGAFKWERKFRSHQS